LPAFGITRKMKFMTDYRQGDVLLVPFPFTDQSGTKQRPAIVLSEDTYNRIHPDLIMAPITSQIKGGADETEVVDWQSAGLLKPSVVKPVLSSFEARLVRRPLGRLSQSDLAQVRSLFARILGLP
jgi:mRNA interferase MazF